MLTDIADRPVNEVDAFLPPCYAGQLVPVSTTRPVSNVMPLRIGLNNLLDCYSKRLP